MENKLLKRKSIRIPKYDYSQEGMYFITICTQGRKKILSNIVGVGVPDDPMHEYTQNQLQNKNEYKIELTQIGKIVEEFINSINNMYKDIQINDYVIMPNHIHMVCIIERHDNGSPKAARPLQMQGYHF